MQLLPRDFLIQLARKYELSPEQEEALVERFSSNKDEQAVAEALYISDNAFRTRMSGVYRKFSISGKGPGKFHKLHNFLIDEYQKSNPSSIPGASKQNLDIDTLVQEVRAKIKPFIQERCGTMRVLDMTQPIGLNDIYTNVNILETITGRRRKGITELLQECKFDNFDRLGIGEVIEKRVPGLHAVEKYPKLIVLGKPGAGKTTFLKYLAIQCIEGKFLADRIPIFVTLKDFAETTNKLELLEYITQQFSNCDLERQLIAPLSNLMKHGKVLILLDGLDEVREKDSSYVLKEICAFSNDFCKNHFVLTCRVAAREYTFERFTEVEVADFDNRQICTFATKWFKYKAVKSEIFIQRLKDNHRTYLLATNPLLLTLLCLAFEETGDFPANRSELYKEGLDALLKKWDAKRGIQRDRAYKKLSVQRKEDLLSKIALTTFKQGDYFFKQKAAEQYITDYIRNLPGAKTEEEELHSDSEDVLRSIEAQHGLLVERAKGIYSFSHLTFHEYFTAREIVVVKQSSEESLQNLISHITEKRWREVFLLAVGMSPSADRLLLLMKQKVDALIAADDSVQRVLWWVNQKACSIQTPYELPAVRAFYLARIRALNITSARARVLNLTLDLTHAQDFDRALSADLMFALERTLDLALDIDRIIDSEHDMTLFCMLAQTLEPELKKVLEMQTPTSTISETELLFISDDDLDRFIRAQSRRKSPTKYLIPGQGRFLLAFDSELNQALEKLRIEVTKQQKDKGKFKIWWDNNGQFWTEELRAIILKHRTIEHDLLLTEQQQQALQHYHDANVLLVECLNSDCYVSREVRQEIEDTLLLPIAAIEQRKRKSV